MKKVILFFLFTTFIYSHGLNIFTAYVTLRNTNHISLTLHFDLIELIENIYKRDNKKFDLIKLANSSKKEFEKEYKKVKELFEKELTIKFNKTPIDSPYFKFFTIDEFKKGIRDKFMSTIIDKQTHSHSHNHYFKKIRVDGFMPKNQTKGDLNIHFPKEIEEVMVTFAKPRTQTIKADNNGSNFKLSIDVF